MNQQPNKLINEKSPYLLQHAYNPVEWYPWGEEAFEKAARENKPVFLSIGYSTCHWCHVMEHESFEDPEVAELMNAVFVSIKVDREERPDIDSIYMTVCQMMTGHGGWPLSIVMTPDKRPFFSGTYFPKESRHGRAGFTDLIRNIDHAWRTRKEEIEKSADEITGYLKQASISDSGIDIPLAAFEKTYEYFSGRYDEEFGGFGNAPKFPSPHNLLFLLRYWKRSGEEKALEMTEKTLLEMSKGGVYDHIGFGFHRYSTDRRWHLPHFEKMLYDQAMLLHAYTETYRITKNEKLRKTAEEIIEYVLRDMTSPEGGFYSAEDADSEGVEGKFYVWSIDEVKEILGEEDGELFTKIYGFEPGGNFEEESSKAGTGKNIPHLTKSFEEWNKELNTGEEKLEARLQKMKNKLFEEREKRVRPQKDDKILTDWNGLMISALTKAGRIFSNEKYIKAGEKAYAFIKNKLTDKSGKLIHRFREEEAKLNANLDDYAFVIWGLIELYESTFCEKYLRDALSLYDITMKHYWDEPNSGFFFTPDFGENLLVRTKEIYDSAIPSGSSVMMNNLIKLSRLTGDERIDKTADLLSKSYSDTVDKAPQAFTYFLTGIDFAKGPSNEIVIIGKKDSDETKKFLNKLNENYLPNKVVILIDEQDRKGIDELVSFVRDYKPVKGKTTAYVCRNFACSLPVTDHVEMMKLLK